MHLAAVCSVWFLASAPIVLGGMIEVTPATAAALSLDIDGDGLPEVEGMSLSPTSEWIGAGITVDGTTEIVTLGGELFRGVSGMRVATLTDLEESKGFASEFTAPLDVRREPGLDNILGGLFLNEDEPLLAIWSFGTTGGGSDPVSLVGYVVDARAHFASGRIAPVRIYYHDYGRFLGGEAPRWISLAETGLPLGETPALAAASEFPDPRIVRFTVASEVGKLYRILRKSASGQMEAVVEKPGTGASLTLEWDDRPRGDSMAMFSLEEFRPDGFSASF